jgi:hypothetical protein
MKKKGKYNALNGGNSTVLGGLVIAARYFHSRSCAYVTDSLKQEEKMIGLIVRIEIDRRT